jgi:carbonic anhydrase/acetyltransferase-like protein (isoleucine patch superfamily)
MQSLIKYFNKKPVIDSSAFVAKGCQLIGSLVIGKECSVWFNSVLRADINHITIGDRTNIQGILLFCD